MLYFEGIHFEVILMEIKWVMAPPCGLRLNDM